MTVADQQTVSAPPVKRKKTVLIALAILVAASIAGLSFGLLTTNQSPPAATGAGQDSWITKGAYATYQGQAEVMSTSISFNAKMEIIDLNATHVEISTSYNMSSPYETIDNTTTTWVSRENMTFQPDGLTLASSYSTKITLPNLGTRSCTAYEYNSDGLTETMYVDNSIQWPIEITMTSPSADGQSYSINIALVQTNIPGL